MQASIVPDSGIQLLMLIGAAFIITATRPDLGMTLLMLGVGAWLFYNLLSISRQV